MTNQKYNVYKRSVLSTLITKHDLCQQLLAPFLRHFEHDVRTKPKVDKEGLNPKAMKNAVSNKSEPFVRNTLGVLLGIVALNAFAGGYYAISGAKGVPTEWLKGTPFKDYFIPGLILLFFVGGAFLLAAVAAFAHLRIARLAARAAVLIVFIWLGIQVAIIGYVSWMQPTTAIVAIAILLIASRLPKEKSS